MSASEITTLVVSIVAALISGLSLLLSGVASGRAKRAEQRAERAEQRAKRAEDRDVRADERDEERTRRQRRGQPLLTPTRGASGGPTAERVSHEYLITNGGSAPIMGMTLWVEDSEGNRVSSPSGGPALTIAPGERTAVIGVEVVAALIRGDGDLTLKAEWTDPDGPHVDVVGHPPKHA